MRSLLAASTSPGDVAVLPWDAFRQFEWNGQRTSLDPAPRWLTRTTVVDDSLLVRAADGTVLTVPGESTRAQVIGIAVASGQPLESTLRREGIGFVLVEGRTPGSVTAAQLHGLVPVFAGSDLALFAVQRPAPVPGVAPWRISLVLFGWLAALLALAWAVVAATRETISRIVDVRRRRGGNVPPPSGRSM